ncbi:hypothetical protein MKZ19_13325 [Shouchella clausii]|uniref:hypothetical protein n=1 Tax=Shouchella clausii TaxID=79880 RepID=UPI0031FC1AA6
MITLFLLLPLLSIALNVGFADAGWTLSDSSSKRKMPFSLGAFILYSYAALCGQLAVSVAFFSYLPLAYATLVWAIGFYYDWRRSNDVTRNVFAWNDPLILIGILAAMLFAWQLTSTVSFWHWLIAIALLVMLPYTGQKINKHPLFLWKASFCFLVVVFFVIETPQFADVLYVVTVFYIAFVLEGEREACFGTSGALLLGSMAAIWAISTHSLTLQFACLAVSIFLAYIPLTQLPSRIGVFRWMGELGISKHE